jgi:hypothetical protein
LGAVVRIAEFADRVVVAGNPFVVVYCRVTVTNPTDAAIAPDPEPSAGLVPIRSAPATVSPHSSAVHDYVVAADRFEGPYR